MLLETKSVQINIDVNITLNHACVCVLEFTSYMIFCMFGSIWLHTIKVHKLASRQLDLTNTKK